MSGESVITTDPEAVAPNPSASRHTSGRQGQATKWARYLCVLLATFAAVISSHPIAAAQIKETRRILILNEVGTSYPGIAIINQGIQSALNNSPYHLEFYSEYMDTGLFPDPAVQQEFREFYIRKYQNRKPDVIITVGPSPLRFMEEVHQRAFSGVPIVFCLPAGAVPGAPPLDSDFAGVENDTASAETLAIALRLRPGTEHVVVVAGRSEFEKPLLALIKQQLKPFTEHLDITYMTDLAVPALLDRLRYLPRHTIVILVSVGQDAEGNRFKSSEIGPLVTDAANAPVFSLADVYLNHGEVGGYLSSLSEQGKVAGSMAMRMLQGEKPQDIPRVKGVNTYMFDWRAIKRWGLMEKEIPVGSIVLNRQLTVWESYKWYIIGGISLILVETLLIFGLVWQRDRAKKAEAELVISYDRLRLAVEAGKSVGWDWDIRSGRDRWFGDLETVFGIPSDNYSGHVDDFRRKVHPDDRELVWQGVADARQNRKPYATEFRVVRTDGTVRWITARGKFYYAHNGNPERMLGMAVDITDRKQAEQKLRESENRLAGIVGSAMDAIIAVNEEQRIVLFNAAAEKMFGCTHDEALGTAVDRFIPHRFRSEHGAHMRRFGESGITTRMMGIPARLWEVRTNGDEFPIDASITQLESAERKLFTVIIRDITERCRAEEKIRESEERFRLVANTAPVMIWMAGTDRKCSYVNKTWLDFIGRPLEAELGDDWAGGLHPDDLARSLQTYTEAFDRRESFELQYRLRRHDGEYRWILDKGVPRFNPDGTFAGYIDSCIDITERKLAEEGLATIGRRLIEAQEEERAWIGRELHDDINQRLALLAVELDRWNQHIFATPELSDQIRHAQERISQIAKDVQGLSHRLHSSKLEYLGLATAANSFCKEVSEQNKVEVQFKHAGIPRDLPKEVSLCLFRVLQEALQNALKHSGVRSFAVNLHGTAGVIDLTVADFGSGFEEQEAFTRHGLGLISMRERLQLVRGELSVKSKPGSGTTIHARVPLKAKEYRAMVG